MVWGLGVGYLEQRGRVLGWGWEQGNGSNGERGVRLRLGVG